MFIIDKEDPLSRKRRERQAKLRKLKGEVKAAQQPKKKAAYTPRHHRVEPEGDPCTGENLLLPACRRLLMGRMEELTQGFRLDGRPAGWPDVVKAANRRAKELGWPQVGKNREWWAR